MPTLIDISPLVGPDTAIWPGDQRYETKTLLALEDGASVALSMVTTTLHIGAHADAPNHYTLGAPSIDQVDLGAYWGLCQVVETIGEKQITASHCPDQFSKGVERVLFKTGTMPDWKNFNEDFAYFDISVIEKLGKLGVKLIGIDTPSVDEFSSKTLPVHHALMRHGIRNLEGLVLGHVKPGIYELVALPLKLVGADASPVRAVLKTLS